MNYTTYTLPNGLRLIHAPAPTHVAYCGYAIDAGTRDEAESEEGLAHFVEHLLFKGTTHRKAWHILNRMENVGGDLNAYTNKEETVVYCAFLKEHFSRAAELLTDIVFHSTFPAAEVKKEVEVIIDEIQSYEDSPAELIYDDFEEMLYAGHPLGRNILGRPELLRTFTNEDARRWVDRFYRTTNMVFFVWADLDVKYIIRRMEQLTADIPCRSVVGYTRVSPPPYRVARKQLNRDTHQAHVMLGCRGYHAYDERRTGLYLLNNVLGGPGMNSLLNVALREKRGLVYNVESSIISYTDTGTFGIYFGCDPEDADRCLQLVRKELRLLCEAPMTENRLKAAKKQILGQIGVASDNFENVALDMGKCFLHYGRYEAKEEVHRRIQAVTAESLQQIACELFADDRLSLLMYK